MDLRTPRQKADKLGLDELVCMTRDEMNKHEEEVFRDGKEPEQVYDQDVVQVVARRMEEERAFRRQR